MSLRKSIQRERERVKAPGQKKNGTFLCVCVLEKKIWENARCAINSLRFSYPGVEERRKMLKWTIKQLFSPLPG